MAGEGGRSSGGGPGIFPGPGLCTVLSVSGGASSCPSLWVTGGGQEPRALLLVTQLKHSGGGPEAQVRMGSSPGSLCFHGADAECPAGSVAGGWWTLPRASLREGDCKSRCWVLWASLPVSPGRLLILSVVSCVFKWGSSVFTCYDNLAGDTFCFCCAAKRAFLNRRAVCYEQLKKAVWGAWWK